MDGYDVEELYYLYLQDCPEAKRYLMKFCYKQIEIILPKYYISTIYKDEYEDYIQLIMVRVFKSLNNYRPDKGMKMRSFISMLIENAIKSIVLKNSGKVIREKRVVYSLDDYYKAKKKIRYVTNLSDERTPNPNRYCIEQEQQQEIDKYLLQVCSELEQKIVKYHQAGYKNQDIARILNIDIRSVYNANYRIQKKIAKFKCI